MLHTLLPYLYYLPDKTFGTKVHQVIIVTITSIIRREYSPEKSCRYNHGHYEYTMQL